MSDETDLLIDVRGALGTITLNRPKVLNALTLDMVRGLLNRLDVWRDDPAIAAVLIKGAGEKAFCSGGDIRRLYDSGKAGDGYYQAFYLDEYRLNVAIKEYPKPVVVLASGIVMGGGVGIAAPASHRVVTETTVYAMPETGIGFFPDVGGSYFLSRMPGRIGVYLALTGARIGAADCLLSGFANAFVAAEALTALETALAGLDPAGRDPFGAVSQALAGFTTGDPGPAALRPQENFIEHAFGPEAVEEIIELLTDEAAAESPQAAWAGEALAILQARSPTSLKLTRRQIAEGADLDFRECMAMELRLAYRCLEGHDFYEGVRAAILDKDHAPRWSPAAVADVDDARVDGHFAGLGDQEPSF